MAKKINIVGARPKRITILDQPKRRIDAAEIAAGLGATPCGERVSGHLDPIGLAELGTQLLRRLRSSGGRPALADATEICRVPLSSDDVKALEQIMERVAASTGAKPSLGQLVSVIIHASLPAGEGGGGEKTAEFVALQQKIQTLREQNAVLEQRLAEIGAICTSSTGA
jgi:hypothetical protein